MISALLKSVIKSSRPTGACFACLDSLNLRYTRYRLHKRRISGSISDFSRIAYGDPFSKGTLFLHYCNPATHSLKA